MPRTPSSLVGYFASFAAVTTAIIVTYAIYDWVEPSISLLFFPAVVIPAMYGGYGPAFVATVLSTAALAYFFVAPRYSFNIGIDDAIRLGVFVLVSFATAWLSSARRRAEDAQRQSVAELRAAIVTLQKVSGWPVVTDLELAAGIRKMLRHAASVVGAADVVATWESDDEPWAYVAATGDRDSVARYPPNDFPPVVAKTLEQVTFVCADGDSAVLISREGATTKWSGAPVRTDFVARFRELPFASAPFRTERLTGRVFFIGVGQASVIPAVDVAAREVGNSIDQMCLADRARELAVREDRIRLSRDLHDGVLQALTGIRLKLQSMADARDAQSSRHDELLAIERALAIEQRELRLFIDELKPVVGAATRPGSIAQRLHAMCARLSVEWTAPIQVSVAPADLSLSDASEQSLRLMVHEAVVNALKHAQPTRVVVTIESDDRTLRVTVTDDGKGFPFRGRLEHEALVTRNTGPASLRERVVALDGRMAIESTPSGSRVEFAIPAADRPAR